MALNPAQVAVLKALEGGPKETSNRTTATTVSGSTAWGLNTKGLVKVSTKKGIRTQLATITPAGKKALAAVVTTKPAKTKKAPAKKAA